MYILSRASQKSVAIILLAADKIALVAYPRQNKFTVSTVLGIKNKMDGFDSYDSNGFRRLISNVASI